MSDKIILLIIIIFLNWVFITLWLYFIIKALLQFIFAYWVPFVPTPDKKIKILLDNLEIKEDNNFVDIWCGDWRIMASVEEKFPKINVYGYENSILPYQKAIKNKQKNNLNYTVYKKDFLKENLSKYDVIYCYMIPYMMPKIWSKIKKECKKWTLFYTSSFDIKSEKYYKKIEIKKWNHLYIYKV